RVHARRGDSAEYLERLRAAGLDCESFGTRTIVLAAPCPVSRLPGFGDGDVSVQDAGAQMAAPLLLQDLPFVRPERPHVLDACAAPGGKTAHLLELADLDLL